MTAAGQARTPALDVRTLADNVGVASASCSECPWTRSGAGRREWLAIRAAARRHVDALGHPVVAAVVHLLTYAPAARD